MVQDTLNRSWTMQSWTKCADLYIHTVMVKLCSNDIARDQPYGFHCSRLVQQSMFRINYALALQRHVITIHELCLVIF